MFIQVADDSEKVDYTAAAFHPDGLILGTGTSQSVVKIWDVKSQVNKLWPFRLFCLLKKSYVHRNSFDFNFCVG